MIVDSSAVLVIAFQEPEAARFAAAILNSSQRHMSNVNWLETMLVVQGRWGASAADDALVLIQQLGIETLPFDASQMHEALEAWRRYGKGRHAAALNLGDCCAYAASKVEGRPLLFKGGDFDKTDIARAVW